MRHPRSSLTIIDLVGSGEDDYVTLDCQYTDDQLLEAVAAAIDASKSISQEMQFLSSAQKEIDLSALSK